MHPPCLAFWLANTHDPFAYGFYADIGLFIYTLSWQFFRMSRKQRPRKRRQQIADLENTDPRKLKPLKHRPWKLNTDPEKGQNIVCVLTGKISFFKKSIGESKLKRAQNYHRDGFKFIDKLSLPETSKLTDEDVADSFDCTSSSRLQHIKYKRRWNFIK